MVSTAKHTLANGMPHLWSHSYPFKSALCSWVFTAWEVDWAVKLADELSVSPPYKSLGISILSSSQTLWNTDHFCSASLIEPALTVGHSLSLNNQQGISTYPVILNSWWKVLPGILSITLSKIHSFGYNHQLHQTSWKYMKDNIVE